MKELGIEEIKDIQNKILRTFASFCETNGLTYYLAYGTLIGAIRHQGYIPWDDDIDVIMPRADYEKFISTFSNERYKVFCPEYDKSCPFTYGKLYDGYTHIDECTTRKFNIGLNIDLFILDGLPSDKKESSEHIKKNSFWINVLEIKKIAFVKKRGLLKNVELFLLKSLVSPIPYNWVRNKIVNIDRRYKFGDTGFCADLCYAGALRLNKDLFETGNKGIFEGREYSIPKGYDEWLKSYYGNYMELPPVEKRVTHHYYKAYLKDINCEDTH